jgi:uncharacterized SAM-binding protein YcdF (DUF218 family)
MNSIIDDIGNFIFVENQPELCDVIMVVGGSHPELGEKAAELWKQGFAPLCFVGGGVSVKSGVFPGPKSKADIYNENYATEFDFLTDVLIKNGVNKNAIIGESKSSFTRENAVIAKQTCDDKQMIVKKAIIVCKRFHARRSLMFFQSAFPGTVFAVAPVDSYNITKDNWYKTEYGVSRVLGELRRCGDQFSYSDINNLVK